MNIYTGTISLGERVKTVEEITAKMMAGDALTEEDRRKMKQYDIRLREKKIVKKKTATNGGDCIGKQKIVSEDELPTLLGVGWKFVACLSNGKVVVEAKD